MTRASTRCSGAVGYLRLLRGVSELLEGPRGLVLEELEQARLQLLLGRADALVLQSQGLALGRALGKARRSLALQGLRTRHQGNKRVPREKRGAIEERG